MTIGVQEKKAGLKAVYYRRFLFLIVIPLILVFVAAEIIIGYIIRGSTIDTIDAFQENVATALSNDVKTASLQLSHFVYVNDGEFPMIAVEAATASRSDQYEANQQLQKAFRTAMVPSQDIVAGAFYMKNHDAVYMKDEIILPPEEITSSDWYQRAKQNPNQVALGGYDIARTRLTWSVQKTNQFILVTSMATDLASDRTDKIDVICFFTISQIGDILSAQNRDANLGQSLILDETGHVIFGDMGNETIRAYFAERPGQFTPGSQTRRASFVEGKNRDYFFRVRAIPDTAWTLVTFLEEPQLGQRFYEVGSLLALVVMLLLMFFYIYSYSFLNDIITPVHTVCEGMRRLDGNDLEVQLEPTGHQEIQELMTSFNQMVLSIRNMIDFTEQTAKRKHEAELQALQSQINPHFIVNTLNSIRFMAQVAKFDGIRKMAEALVSIVSCSFRSNLSFYTVGEELEMLKTYEYIMRIRYSNSFEVSYEVEDECLDYRLPRLTLQPVMENAIVHGFSELDDELGKIEVHICTQEDYLCLSVRDNGRGMSQKKIHQLLSGRNRPHDDNSSIGLENVLTRLRLHFGSAVGIEIHSQLQSHTHIIFKLPLDACTKSERKGKDHDSGSDR